MLATLVVDRPSARLHCHSSDPPLLPLYDRTKPRLAAKELGGVFNFSHKAFIKLVSSKRGGGSSSGAANVSDAHAPSATTGTGQAQEGDGVEAVAGAAGGGKKAKRKRKAAEAAAAAAAASRRENGDTTAENGRERKGSQDIRHLSVEFLCAFMDSGECLVGEGGRGRSGVGACAPVAEGSRVHGAGQAIDILNMHEATLLYDSAC